LIQNSIIAGEKGIDAFLWSDCKGWTCADCGGAFSLHDGICSECGGNNRLEMLPSQIVE
jgi:hypothetical protein